MAEDLTLLPFKTQERIECCRVLWLGFQGRHHERIETEMRAMGHERFNRRVLYARDSRGKRLAGWPERFGWLQMLQPNGQWTTDNGQCGSVGGVAADPDQNASEKQSFSAHRAAEPQNSEKRKTESGKCEEAGEHGSASGPNDSTEASPSASSLFPLSTVRSPLDFAAWLRHISPTGYTWDKPFQTYIIDRLEKFSRGEITRLMIFMPPRHGKSELVTVRYAAWRLRQRPEERIVIASYAQKLANRFSRQIKRVVADDELLNGTPAVRVFPKHDKANCLECLRYAAECRSKGRGQCPKADAEDRRDLETANRILRLKDTEAEWETPEGGGIKAIGAGAGITGFGANLIIVDDPVKSREEAESENIRERIWHWFNDDLYTRLEPNGQIILIQTRWHQDDLAGRLLAEAEEEDGEQWEVIELPALAEGSGQWPVLSGQLEESEKPGENGQWTTDSGQCRADGGVSPAGTPLIAQGAGLARDPGCEAHTRSDPEGVEQCGVAPLQGAAEIGPVPGVTRSANAHPRLLCASPSATKPTGSEPPASAGGNGVGVEATYLLKDNAGCAPDVVPPAYAGPGSALRCAEKLCFSEGCPDSNAAMPPNAEDGGVAAGPDGGRSEKQSFSAHRAAEPREKRIKEKGERIKEKRLPDHCPPATDPHCREATDHCKDLLGRSPGEPLWPERFDVPKLERYRKKLGSYSFAALYQQRPVPAEGGFFKRSWFRFVDIAPKFIRWKRGYDLAFSAGERSDYTASARVGFDNSGNIYIDKVLRRKMEYPEQKRTILGLIKSEPDAEHLIEETANGAALIQELRRSREILGRRFRAIKVKESKTARALAWNALAEEGRVFLTRGPWNRDFIEEACTFPYSTHDDQIDAVSLAVHNKNRGYRAYGF